MRLSTATIRRLASGQGKPVSEILRRASVSRTAYYSLARRGNLLPGTVHRLAETLGVRPAEILEDAEGEASTAAAARIRKAREICARNPGVSFEDIWHVLSLLDRPPLDRLRGSLVRGGATALRR